MPSSLQQGMLTSQNRSEIKSDRNGANPKQIRTQHRSRENKHSGNSRVSVKPSRSLANSLPEYLFGDCLPIVEDEEELKGLLLRRLQELSKQLVSRTMRLIFPAALLQAVRRRMCCAWTACPDGLSENSSETFGPRGQTMESTETTRGAECAAQG